MNLSRLKFTKCLCEIGSSLLGLVFQLHSVQKLNRVALLFEKKQQVSFLGNKADNQKYTYS